MPAIHPQLRQDCIPLGQLGLCHLLLMNDANYPWCILVPDREGIREIYELSLPDQQLLLHESSMLAAGMAHEFVADKMNIAALGNVVPQLHVHHIARYKDDPAWPAPVWGKFTAKPYSDVALEQMRKRMATICGDQLHPG